MTSSCKSLRYMLLLVLFGSVATAAAATATAEKAFPVKPIRIVVPFPAGGTTDVIARLVAQRMSETMKQPVVVDNRGGAGGAIGADIVAKADRKSTRLNSSHQ